MKECPYPQASVLTSHIDFIRRGFLRKIDQSLLPKSLKASKQALKQNNNNATHETRKR